MLQLGWLHPSILRRRGSRLTTLAFVAPKGRGRGSMPVVVLTLAATHPWGKLAR